MYCTFKLSLNLYNFDHPCWMVLRKGTRVIERFFIAQCNQGLDVFLQADRAPRGDRPKTTFGKIPASKYVPGTARRGCQEFFTEEPCFGEIWRVRCIVPGLCRGELRQIGEPGPRRVVRRHVENLHR